MSKFDWSFALNSVISFSSPQLTRVSPLESVRLLPRNVADNAGLCCKLRVTVAVCALVSSVSVSARDAWLGQLAGPEAPSSKIVTTFCVGSRTSCW